VYDSQKQWKANYEITLSGQHGDRPLYKGPLQLEAVFYFPMPMKWTAQEKQEKEGAWYIQVPDTDNLIKLLMDCGNGILYQDDRTICRSIEEKRYSKEPRTEFIIVELK
jgi:Holliday junction resolvase RusA-like endonuclease